MNDDSNNRQGNNSSGGSNSFLEACAEAIKQDFPEVRCRWSSSYSGERIQQLELHIPESKFPIPYFNPEKRTWFKTEFVKTPWKVELEHSLSEPLGEAFVLRQDGTLVYGYPDDRNTFLRLTHSLELVEILGFLLNREKQPHNEIDPFAQGSTIKRKLSEVFRNLCLIVCIDQEPYILDLKRHLQDMPEDFRSTAEGHFIALTPRIYEYYPGSDMFFPVTTWRSLCESHSAFLKSLNLPKLPPLGFVWRFSFFQLLSHTHYKFVDEYGALGIYLSPNLKKASSAFLSDYFTYTLEGETVINHLRNARSLSELPTRMSEIPIEIPSDKEQQIRWAIELRAMREFVRVVYRILSRERTTTRSALDLTWKKWKCAGITQTAYLGEVDSLLQPLPYFIENPYRNFCRADPGYETAHAGVSFASQLYRVMTCLAIEEFEQNWSSSGEPRPPRLASAIADIDSDKPVSDGTWATLFSLIWEQAAKYIPLMSSIGFGYYQKSDKISELIATRNKCWGHSTESDRLSRREMVDELETKLREILPILVSVLRDGFRDKDILIPLNAEFREGIGQVFRAKSVMGFESDFGTVVRPIVEGMDNYIDRRLIMYSGNAFVALRKYFSCDEIYEDFFRVGLKK